MNMRAAEIATLLGGQVRGNPDIILEGLRPLTEANEHHLSFFYKEAYRGAARISHAGMILVGREADLQRDGLIEVPDVRDAYRKAIRIFHPVEPSERGISPYASIDESAILGESVHIGSNAVISADVVIGKCAVLMTGVFIGPRCSIGCDTVIENNAVIKNASIGNRVTIGACAVIGSDGFGFHRNDDATLQRIPQAGRVVIEDDVEVGSCACVDRATLTNTCIGAGTKIESLVLIGHNVKIGENCLIIGQSGVAGSAIIGSGSSLYGQVGIRGHLKIGRGVTVFAKSLVTRDVPDDQTVSGIPALPVDLWRRIVRAIILLPDAMTRYFTHNDS